MACVLWCAPVTVRKYLSLLRATVHDTARGSETIHSPAQMREMGLYSGFVTQVHKYGKELLRELFYLVIRACCKVPTDLMVTIMCL